jgi:16S rRNA (uracil1498-N3)-methyltransferase
MASTLRLFTDTDLHSGQIVQPDEGQAHYVTSVMRRGAGDNILLFNGRDGEWLSRLSVSRRQCCFEIMSQSRPQISEPDLWLAFSPLKRHAMELIVQKATELGASALLPVITQRTQTERVNTARWQAIAIEAAEQSERLTVPTIHPPQGLSTLMVGWSPERPLYLAAERRAAPKMPAMRGPSAVLVGPEGGFLSQELDALCAHPFVHPVSLGPRILRAETAAIVGLALLLLSG